MSIEPVKKAKSVEELIEHQTLRSRFETFIARLLYERGLEFFDKIILTVSVISALSLVPIMIINPERMPHYVVYSLLLFLGPYGFYRLYLDRITEDIERVFPDFLRDLAENRRSGMSLVESMKIQAQGNYRKLTPYIKQMAAAMSWGVTIYDVLDKLANRLRSNLIRRALSIIREGADSGGEFSDVLYTAARDIREILELEVQRKSQTVGHLMTMYISHAVFIFVIIILIKFFFPHLEATGSTTGRLGGITIMVPDIKSLVLTLYYGSLVQAVGVGLVGGIVYDGKISGSVKHMFILIVITYLIYYAIGIIH
ncbi:MAG: type II secretion system F family protein [Euryarchaeota archaeon]|nr:type II secretion system F family protein [Euryarchaeota archaeon]